MRGGGRGVFERRQEECQRARDKPENAAEHEHELGSACPKQDRCRDHQAQCLRNREGEIELRLCLGVPVAIDDVGEERCFGWGVELVDHPYPEGDGEHPGERRIRTHEEQHENEARDIEETSSARRETVSATNPAGRANRIDGMIEQITNIELNTDRSDRSTTMISSA